MINIREITRYKQDKEYSLIIEAVQSAVTMHIEWVGVSRSKNDFTVIDGPTLTPTLKPLKSTARK